jgi:DNA-binding PadR family transcriptional regulator
MQDPTFLVLTVLAGPPLHGYAIMQAIDELVGRPGVVRPGTLYAALDRLTADALIEVAHTDEWADGRVRRYYRLTSQGSEALREEAQRRHRLAGIALRRLSLATDPGAGPAPSPA